MKKALAIKSQLIAIIRQDRHPSAYTWGYWAWKWDKNGNVKYLQVRTLINFITNKKTV